MMIHRYEKQIEAIQNNDLSRVKSLFNNEDFDPSFLENWAIRYSAEVGNIEICKLLLKDERVNPTSCKNSPIIEAFNSKNIEITQLLWNDIRVKKSLQKDDEELYNYLMKESIKKKVSKFNHE
jgi:hypothetical protein